MVMTVYFASILFHWCAVLMSSFCILSCWGIFTLEVFATKPCLPSKWCAGLVRGQFETMRPSRRMFVIISDKEVKHLNDREPGKWGSWSSSPTTQGTARRGTCYHSLAQLLFAQGVEESPFRGDGPRSPPDFVHLFLFH